MRRRSPRAFRRRLRLLQRALEISDARRVLRRRRLRGLGVHGAFVLEFGDARFKRVLTSLDVCERCAKMLRLSLGGVRQAAFRCPARRVRSPSAPDDASHAARASPPRARRPGRVRLSRLSAYIALDRSELPQPRAPPSPTRREPPQPRRERRSRSGFEGVDPSPGLLSRGRRCEFGGLQFVARP